MSNLARSDGFEIYGLHEMGIFWQKILIILSLLLFSTGCIHKDRILVSEKYPDLKWGFTTQNFIETTPVSVNSAKQFISYARRQGYSWIEFRDPDASLTVEQCAEIAAFAEVNGIEVNYTVQRGLLESDFWEIFHKALPSIKVFNGPGYFRALAVSGSGEFGWTKEEFTQLVGIANQASAIATRNNVRFTVENANTDIDGYGNPYYGLDNFLKQSDPEVTLQLDTANLFTGSVPVTANLRPSG